MKTTRMTRETRRMRMMGKMKVKMKVKDDDLTDFSFRGFTWLEQCTMDFTFKN